jgi:hypothetical protein
LSRPLAVAQTPPEGLDMTISANEQERAALAAAIGVPALDRLEARLEITRLGLDGLTVRGEVTAELRQICVVTLEEFEARVVEPIEARFAPLKQPAPATPSPKGARRAGADRQTDAPERRVDALDDDPPDPLIGGVVDLGALVCEFLALGLDPYPRKPGARFAEPAPAEADAEVSPFAKLRSNPRISTKAEPGGRDP